MPQSLRVLILEDRPADAELMLHELRRAGFVPDWLRVESEQDYLAALDPALDVILADYNLTQYDAARALRSLQERRLDVPFIVVTGSISEEIAVECMKQGAADYLLKDRLARLGTAVSHAVHQRQLRKEKLETEEHLRLQSTVLDAAANAVVITVRDGRIAWINPAFTRLTGYTFEDVWGQNPRVLKSGRHDSRFYQAMWEMILAGRVWHGDLVNRRKDGTLYDEEMTITPVRDTQGEISHFIGIKQDVTERTQAEAALRGSEERYRSLFENQLNGVAYCRMLFDGDRPADFLYLSVNRAFEELTGLNNVVGKKVSEVIPGIREADSELFETYARVARTGKPERFEIYVAALKEWFLVSAFSPERDQFVAVFDVITDRKKAEQALLESRNALQAVVDTSPLAIVVTDRDGGVTLWNGAAERSFGWAAAEVLGKPNPSIPPDKFEEAQTVRRDIVAGRVAVGYETLRQRKDGIRLVVSVSATALREADGTVSGVLAIVSDLTEQKRLEAQLRQQQKLEAIGTLASGVAHEINNPLAGIMNYAQLIADTVPADHPAAAHAQEIVQESLRVATIVRNLLQFARQEKQHSSPARLSDLVEGTLSLVRAALRRDQIALTVDVPEVLPPVSCRSQQIQQVLMNLLTNARDALNAKYPAYHPDKTLTVTARIVTAPGTSNPQSPIGNRQWSALLRLTVADRGTGIPPAIQDRIFDPFFTTKPRDQGTGLGLAISHGIVMDHHGRLTYETVPGEGTAFHLDLPVEDHVS
jgi:PAS domain S-box-containing protein